MDYKASRTSVYYYRTSSPEFENRQVPVVIPVDADFGARERPIRPARLFASDDIEVPRIEGNRPTLTSSISTHPRKLAA